MKLKDGVTRIKEEIKNGLEYIISNPKKTAAIGLAIVGTAGAAAQEQDETRIMPNELNSVLSNWHVLQPAAETMYATTPYKNGDETLFTLNKLPINQPDQHLEFQPISVNDYFKSWHKRIDATTQFNKETKKQYHKNLIELADTLRQYVSADTALWNECIKDGNITRDEFELLQKGLYAVVIISKDQNGKAHASSPTLVCRGAGYTPGKPIIRWKNVTTEPKIAKPKNPRQGFALGAGAQYGSDLAKVIPEIFVGYNGIPLGNTEIDINAGVGILMPSIKSNYDTLWVGPKGYTQQYFAETKTHSHVFIDAVIGKTLKLGGRLQHNWNDDEIKSTVDQTLRDKNDNDTLAIFGMPQPTTLQKNNYLSGGPVVKLHLGDGFNITGSAVYANRQKPYYAIGISKTF